MSGTDLTSRFREFFGAVNGDHSPYPWQIDLCLSIAETGAWPQAISAPTGAGKSSVVDIHVFLNAERALATKRARGQVIGRAPRRLILVSPRRVLVDDQYERGLALRQMLAGARGRDDLLGELADAMQGLVSRDDGDGDLSPLAVTRLRGGVRLDLDWRLDPTCCQIICATPQMWGSRLLLRGYGGSRRSRNLEAGLLGCDAAAVIDEAHLHPRLVATARRVAQLSKGDNSIQIVGMSATQTGDGVSLSDLDLDDRGLNRRVTASKQVRTVSIDAWKEAQRADALVEAARQTSTGEGMVGIFVNNVAVAQRVASTLLKDGSETALVCGRMRPADLERLRDRHPGLLSIAGAAELKFLVSTQSLEVGVDLDLAGMVTEIAPPSALAQRAGRLNRTGGRAQTRLTVIFPAEINKEDLKPNDYTFLPYSGADLLAGLAWLQGLGGDGSPLNISQTPMPEPDSISLPELTIADLEIASMTGDRLSADIEPAFFIDEPREQPDQAVSIGARDHLSEAPSEAVRLALLALPPRDHELATMGLGSPGRPAKLLSQLLGESPGSWLLHHRDGDLLATPVARAEDLRDGDVVVIPAGSRVMSGGVIGGARRDAAEPIDDVRHLRPDGERDQIIALPADEVGRIISEHGGIDRRATRTALADLIESTAIAAVTERKEAVRRLRHSLIRDLRAVWCVDEASDPGGSIGLLVLTAPSRGRVSASALTEREVTLTAHGRAVEDRMEAIVDRLGLPAASEHREALRSAARLHDAGKAHPRFQSRMGVQDDAQPLAKPKPGHRADRGDGWRHEQLSAGYAAAESDRDKLLTAIVAAHHGHGRPLFDRDADDLLDGWEAPSAVVAEVERLFGLNGDYERDRARVQADQGVHGLAFLEALLRCADMQASREVEDR